MDKHRNKKRKRQRGSSRPPPMLSWGGNSLLHASSRSKTSTRQQQQQQQQQQQEQEHQLPPLNGTRGGSADAKGPTATFVQKESSKRRLRTGGIRSSSSRGRKQKRAPLSTSTSSFGGKSAGLAKAGHHSQLWTDKYTPTLIAKLCVAPKKIKELVHFLNNGNNDNDNNGTAKGLWILVGSPGIGKSTMVRVVADQLGWERKEWTEEAHAGHYVHGAMPLQQASPLTLFGEFLKQSSFSLSMSVVTKKESRGNSTDNPQKGKSMVVIDEIPYLHDEQAQRRFR